MNYCPCCGQAIRVKQDERHKAKRQYARIYRKSDKQKAYHCAYMQQWRARKLIPLNKTPAAVSEEKQWPITLTA